MAEILMRISSFHSTVLSSPTISLCRPLCATMQDFQRCKWRQYAPETWKISCVLVILADRRDGAEPCYRGISSSPCLSSGLVCWVPEETFPVLCYKAVRSPSTDKQSLQSLAAVSPSGENSGSCHCGDPSVLGLCGPPALFGGGHCGGLCSAIIRNRVCAVLLHLVISASPLIFCQLWQVFLVMLFWLCSSEVFCSVSVTNAVFAYWNISADLQLPQLFHSCHPVSW